MNRQTFNTGMVGLAEYYNKQIENASFFDIYWRKVKYLSDEQFLAAIDQCIDNLKFFPKVSEILQFTPKPQQLENKGSLEWCDNTQALLDKYSDYEKQRGAA